MTTRRRPSPFVLLSLPLLALALLACHKNQYLTGYFSRQEFIAQCKWRVNVNDKYKPDPLALKQLAKADSFDVVLFVGTWCSDSRKLVPKFFAMQPQMPVKSLQIISVDTTKKDALQKYVEYDVDTVPTFVFLRQGTELGRIIEKPAKKVTLEQAMAKIVSKK